MRGFCLDLKVITIGLLCVTVGWGLHDADGNELKTGSVDVEAKSNEPLSKRILVKIIAEKQNFRPWTTS